ncbi:hypothetical protein GQ457_12G015550 [Hibiscus cannabinus]
MLPDLNSQSKVQNESYLFKLDLIEFHSYSQPITNMNTKFKPTTSQLTVDHSTIELLRNNGRLDLIEFHSYSQPITNMNTKFPS